MGIVLGIVAEVAASAVAAAAEAAATAAAEAVAEAAAEAAVEAAAEAAAEEAAEAAAAAAEAAAEAATEGGAATMVQVLQWVAKFFKIIKEFLAIDAVFKAAKEVIKSFIDAPGAREKWNKMEKSLHVFTKLASKMEEFSKWLKEHQNDTVKLQGIDVPLESGILNKFMKPLSTAVGILQRLSADVSKMNVKNQMMTDAQITTLQRGIIRIVATFESIAKYKEDNGEKLPVLKSLPITMDEVKEWKDDIGCQEGTVLSLLQLHTYI
ncbi:uncharacterized protein LOC111577819 [Amphiprion ocellaris]|uniref:uncharacterized protein LOC111577819 n=1 Tax=Amphiprion ocellaris TaxID=80972 RepID=UPI000C303710|nr:uncharacterized protein LOC111577819 [Amphiprion ocellaris]